LVQPGGRRVNNHSWHAPLRMTLLSVILVIFVAACDFSEISMPTSLPLFDSGNRISDTPAPRTTAQPDESPRGGIVINLPPTWTPAPAPSQNQQPVPAPEIQQGTGGDVRTYEVQVGDTLAEIALEFEVPMDLIIRANDLVDPDHIEVGQVLVIPPR